MTAGAPAPEVRVAPGDRAWTALAWAALLVVLVVPVWRGADAQFPWDQGLAPGGVLRALGARFGHGWTPAAGPLPFYLDAIVVAPLLLLMRLTHELGQPSATFPWGFAHPATALACIVIATRLVSLLLALGVVALGYRESGRGPAQPARALVPLLFVGSACFAYYAKSSTPDMHALFWLWLAFHFLESKAPAGTAALRGGVSAALAACCTPQALPMAAAALCAACARAFTARRPRGFDLAAPARVALAAAVTYGLLWQLPWNPHLWLAQHVEAPWFGAAPRQFAPGASGVVALLASYASRSFVVFGLPVLFGALLFLATRAPRAGLGARALACAFHLGAIAALGFARTPFLMPMLVLAVPVASRGLGQAARLAVGRREATAALGWGTAAFALLGGPLLTWMLLVDPRLAAERWLNRHASPGESVEIAGNPQFQARVPGALQVVRTSPDSLRASPRGPRGDYVLLSSDDCQAFKRDRVIRAAWWDSLDHPPREGPYAEHLHYDSPYAIRVLEGIPIPPDIDLYVRAGARH